MLQIKNLNKTYSTKTHSYPVLKDLSFEVKKGEFVAVMGPSGSGKSTLLNCISCFIPHDSGQILLNGRDISNLSEKKLSNIRKKKDYDDGRYFDVNAEESKLALFFSNEAYHAITGQNANVTAGSYKTITPADYKENIWDYMDGLYEITNPDTGEKQSLHFSGSLEYNSLYVMSSPYAYVLSDKDYASITKGLSEKYKEHITLFHVKDYENSYAFARDLLNQYIEHATELSAHIGGYDSWEEYIATKKGETYYYGKALTFPQIPQYFLTTGNMRRVFP